MVHLKSFIVTVRGKGWERGQDFMARAGLPLK